MREALATTPEPSMPAAAHAAAWWADGRPATSEAVVAHALAQDTDVVFFGELHGHPEGASWELALLTGLAAGNRPVALGMEFLERDVQPAVDAWLAGDLDDAQFVKAARQGADYAKTHGPLLAFAKAHGLPVIAANAPRPLVTRFRKADADYPAWREALTAEEQALLPRQSDLLDDPYRARFLRLMGNERGPTFFRAQSLWDDAMAEAVADFRDTHPEHRVLLVVGAFHVTGGLGTITKYVARRPQDRVQSVVMDVADGPSPSFDAGDDAYGDVLLEVPRPPATAAPTP